MHPEDIKASLRKRGVTLASLADEFEVTPSAVSHAVAGRYRSARLMARIADILGRPVCSIWTTPKPAQQRAARTAP